MPLLVLFGPTHPRRHGPQEEALYQRSVTAQFPCAPCYKRQCHYSGQSAVFPACFASMTPKWVYQNLQEILK